MPLRQDLAVTGSVNQNGEVQPIGGVNEKVEGFFDVSHNLCCICKGLLSNRVLLILSSGSHAVQSYVFRVEFSFFVLQVCK